MNILALSPFIYVLILSFVLLLLDVFIKDDKKEFLGYVSIALLIMAGIVIVYTLWNKNVSFFEKGILLDNFSLFSFCLLFYSLLFVIFVSIKYLTYQEINFGEYYSILVISLLGMMLMVSSDDLIVILLGLEILAIGSYTLSNIRREDERSAEAGTKFFMLGAFSSAFIIMGIVLLYGIIKSTKISVIFSSINLAPYFLIGFGLVLVGFGFKLTLVPFHSWAPDVFEGAPTPVTTFLSVSPKIAGFAVLLRIFTKFSFELDQKFILDTLWVISSVTMIWGNIAALRQSNLKRMLAYSSIAHSGYILVGIMNLKAKGDWSLLFYLLAYLFMNVGAFASLISLTGKKKEYCELEDLCGIGYRYPWIGGFFSLFLLSLAGFPPTGGFLAKFYLFSSAVRNDYIILVIIAIITTLISVYYYLRVIVFMYMKEEIREIHIELENPPLILTLFLCALGVLQLGIFPGRILYWIQKAIIL
ncbi:MAG: NADH-quinone oxidoreductase subunit N [Acidobacteriota bacterium]